MRVSEGVAFLVELLEQLRAIGAFGRLQICPRGGGQAHDWSEKANVPNIIVWVGSPSVTPSEWHNIKAAEAKEPGTTTDAIADYPYQPQRTINLGDKSKAFVESFVEDAPPGNRYTTYYGLYVYSKHHDLLTFWGWPLSLTGEETIAKHLLTSNRF